MSVPVHSRFHFLLVMTRGQVLHIVSGTVSAVGAVESGRKDRVPSDRYASGMFATQTGGQGS